MAQTDTAPGAPPLDSLDFRDLVRAHAGAPGILRGIGAAHARAAGLDQVAQTIEDGEDYLVDLQLLDREIRSVDRAVQSVQDASR